MAETALTDDDFNFSDFLAEFGRGVPNRIMSDRLREIVRACNETGSKGSITLKLEIGAKGGMAELRASITAKRPEPGLPGGHYFTTEDGGLVEEDPRQLKMPGKIIDVPGMRRFDGGKS